LRLVNKWHYQIYALEGAKRFLEGEGFQNIVLVKKISELGTESEIERLIKSKAVSLVVNIASVGDGLSNFLTDGKKIRNFCVEEACRYLQILAA